MRSRLLEPGWQYIEKISLEDFTPQDWVVMNRQRAEYNAREQARQALRMLESQADDPTFGYMVNNYRHCLESASRAWRDGRDEETIVTCLFHDLGFTITPKNHGDLAAALLKPYVHEKHIWMLERHAIFQDIHAPTFPGVDVNARERWRGHPYFEWAATFVANYDQDATNPDYDCIPLEAFRPMVHRVFARPPSVAAPV